MEETKKGRLSLILSPSENPFLLLHLRQEGHRIWRHLATLVIAFASMGLAWLVAAALVSPQGAQGLSLGEWAAAAVAWTQLGWALLFLPIAKGTFAYDKRLGTLDFVMLTPHKPHELVLKRAMAPFADCLQLTLLAMPFYALCPGLDARGAYGVSLVEWVLPMVFGISALLLLLACVCVWCVVGQELRYSYMQPALNRPMPSMRIGIPKWLWWMGAAFFWLWGIVWSVMPCVPSWCRPLPLLVWLSEWLITPTKLFSIPMIPALIVFPLLIATIVSLSMEGGALISDRDEDFARAKRWRTWVGAAWTLTVLGFAWESGIKTLMSKFAVPRQEAMQALLILLLLWESRLLLLLRPLFGDRMSEWEMGISPVTSHQSPVTSRLFWYWFGGVVRALVYFAVACVLSGISPFQIGIPFLATVVWLALCDSVLLTAVTLLGISPANQPTSQPANRQGLQAMFVPMLWLIAAAPFVGLAWLPDWMRALHPGVALLSLMPHADVLEGRHTGDALLHLPDEVSLLFRLLLPALASALMALLAAKSCRAHRATSHATRDTLRQAQGAARQAARNLTCIEEWLLETWDNPVFQLQLRRAARRYGLSYLSAGIGSAALLLFGPPLLALLMTTWGEPNVNLLSLYVGCIGAATACLLILPFGTAGQVPLSDLYFERDAGVREDLLHTLLQPRDLVLGWAGVHAWLSLQFAAPFWTTCVLVALLWGSAEAATWLFLALLAYPAALLDAVLLAIILSGWLKDQSMAILALIALPVGGLSVSMIVSLPVILMPFAAPDAPGRILTAALVVALLALWAAMPFLWAGALGVMDWWRQAYDDEQPQRFRGGV